MREAHAKEIAILRRRLHNLTRKEVRSQKRIETMETIICSLKERKLLCADDLADF